MLAEDKALLVSGLEEFGRVEFVAEPETPRVAAVYPPHEAALITRLRAGEMTAFEELVEEYQPLVYALAVRVLNDAEDARDAAQETFLKIYRHFAHFRGEASLKTWICRIAVNQARSTERWWRRRQRRETDSLDEPAENGAGAYAWLPSPGVSPEAETLARERGRQLERALTDLSKDYRIAVILRDLEGLSYEEVAYVTGVSVGTVKSRIARGREKLREVLQHRG